MMSCAFQFKCCGVDTYTDWNDTSTMSFYDVPDSCCKQVSKDCGHGARNLPDKEDKIYTEVRLPKKMPQSTKFANDLKWSNSI